MRGLWHLPPTSSLLLPRWPVKGWKAPYSQLACEKLFKHPQVMYFGSFESVFSAIENGFCDYGVLPLENSTAGSVKQIYDLMLRHSSSKLSAPPA